MEGHVPPCPVQVEYKTFSRDEKRKSSIVAKQDIEAGMTFGSSRRNVGTSLHWSKNVSLAEEDYEQKEERKIENRDWSAYIRQSYNFAEQNLITLQFSDSPVYVVFKKILKGDELVTASPGEINDERPASPDEEIHVNSKGIQKYNCFRCQRCNAVFLNMDRLGSHLYHWCRHQKLESIRSPSISAIPFQIGKRVECKVYKCVCCMMLFLSKDTIETHISTCVREQTTEFRDSSRSEIERDRNCCWVCGVFKRSQVIRHERTHFSWDSFICEVCGKTFRRRDKFFKHEIRHSKALRQSRKKKMSSGSKDKSRKSRLPKQNDPTENTVGEGDAISDAAYHCNDCQMKFKYRHTLIRHQLLHENTYYLSCHSCGVLFKRRDHLLRHQRLRHPEE